MLRFWRRNYSVAIPDFESHSVIKVIPGTKPKAKVTQKYEEKVVSASAGRKENSIETKTNVNEMGIQMISKNLFKQIFRNTNASSAEQDLIDK